MLTSLVTLLTVVYFWLTEHARLQRYALAFVPQERRARARDVWNAAETRLGMWVRGELILMSAIGISTGVAYTLLGVPSAILLGLVAALAEAIPIVGPLLGAIPAVLVAATVSPQLAVAVATVYLVLQLVEGNVLVPLVMRNTTGISPFLVDPQRPHRRRRRRLPGRAARGSDRGCGRGPHRGPAGSGHARGPGPEPCRDGSGRDEPARRSGSRASFSVAPRKPREAGDGSERGLSTGRSTGRLIGT
jgi:hypothetical protein